MLRKVKKNGFSTPLHTYQILSWALTLFDIIIISILYQKLHQFIPYCILYYLLQSVVIILTIYLTASDPTDISQSQNSNNDDPNVLYCSVCVKNVYKTSKHCGYCNRCVENFDHHCKILNNCIGKSNYRAFIWLIVGAMLLNVVVLAYSLEVLRCFRGKSRVLVGFSGCLVVKSSGIVIFNGYLIGLHMFLKRKKMTTYEYIVSIRSQDTDRNRKFRIKHDTSFYSREITNQTVPSITPNDFFN
jgi:palmitoyltransferase